MIFKVIKKALRRNFDALETTRRAQTVDYQGCTIVPAPRKCANGWTTEGDIERKVDGEARSEHFIRAETHADKEQAISHSITKAKRIIDEQMAQRG